MHKFVNLEKINSAGIMELPRLLFDEARSGRAAPQKDFRAVTASAAIFRLHRLPRRHRLVF
jgi:hypothetical protein